MGYGFCKGFEVVKKLRKHVASGYLCLLVPCGAQRPAESGPAKDIVGGVWTQIGAGGAKAAAGHSKQGRESDATIMRSSTE